MRAYSFLGLFLGLFLSLSLSYLFSLIFYPVQAQIISQAKTLNITTSIQPLGLILTELTAQTAAKIQVLIPPNQSSHDFQLKPKAVFALTQADLIIWVGPQLENFLNKPIQGLRDSNQRPNVILTLLSEPSIQKQLLSFRTGAQWQDVHHHHNNHNHDHDHDPHIWLSPQLTLEIAKLIAKKLIALNPAQAALYFKNFQAFTKQLIHIDKLYREAFNKPTQRYLVLHDSYQYIEKQYGLSMVGVLSIHADRPPSIKTLREAQKKITAHHVTCLLSEPPLPASLSKVLLEGQVEPKAKFVQLSPLADKFSLIPGHYEQWQYELINNIKNCR